MGGGDHSDGGDSLLRSVATALVGAGVGPGVLLANGRFEVVRQLGAGGMGTVFEAKDTRDGGRVALKVLRGVGAEATHRLKKEFRALSDVVHPNLIALHELHAGASGWFFTMELFVGVPFLEYVRGARDVAYEATVASDQAGGVQDTAVEAPLDEAKLRVSLAQLVSGVRAIHEAGKLHRDLKPSNVLVGADGQLKILDFGLAGETSKPGATQTADKHSAGTPAYMAPEQFQGGTTSEASDWYAVGVMLFEALTGRLPFTGSVHDIMLAKRESKAPRVHEVDGRAPEDLALLADGLLARSPDARPSVEAIVGALALGEVPTLAPERSPAATAFVGRGTELTRLRDAYARLEEGQGTICLIGGVSGMGKSALLDELLRDIQQDTAAVVLRGRCYEREAVPFNAFDGLMDALATYLERLAPVEVGSLLPRDVHSLTRVFPALSRVAAIRLARGRAPTTHDAVELQNRAFNALSELLLRLTDGAFVVVVIDDLQWGDRDSAQLLNHLLLAEALPILTVLAFRSDEVDSSVCLPLVLEARGSWRQRGLHVPIEPLSFDESRELAQQLLPEEPKKWDSIATASGGSPFFISQLAQHAAARRVEDVESVLTARIANLDARARAVLCAVAVAGRAVPTTVALRAAGLSGQDQGTLHALYQACLLRSLGTAANPRVETYHDQIRSAVEASLSKGETVACHRALLEAYERTGERDAAILVRHLAGAGHRERARTVALAHAEESIESLAFERAATLLAVAAENTVGHAARRALLIRRAEALCDAGFRADAARVFLQAARQVSGVEELDLRRRAAQQLSSQRSAAFPPDVVDCWRAAIDGAHGVAALALPQPNLREARRLARRLERNRNLMAAPMATALRAGLARAAGNRGGCVVLLENAAAGFNRVSMKLHAAACRYRAGELLGGARGARLFAEGEAVMREEGIVDPNAYSRLHAPFRLE